ncbi:MAG: hypothetical protein ICV60_19310 [Pyrinomonadaceae bacterium]|nr:hypothetical protein [Pyrinomonadaceae bacterium]
MKIWLSILVLLLSVLTSFAQNNKSVESSDIPTITFCDLIQNPDLYDGKEVRFRVKYLANSEVGAFGDPNCSSKENRTWAEFDGASIKANSEPEIYQKVVERILCGKCAADDHWRETEMLVTGIFNGSDIGHGRLGEYRFVITIKKIEEIRETEKTTMPAFAP